MNRFLSSLIVLLFMCYPLIIYGQAPQGIPYQAIARSSSGTVLASTGISVRFSIRDSIATGTIKYRETFSVTTTAQGMFSVNVGQGTPVTGTFSGINWGHNAKFMQVEIDPTGGTTYTDMGTQQMMSVPYALYAGGISANSVPQPLVQVFTVSGSFVTPITTTSATVFKIVITGGGGAGGRSMGGSSSSSHGGAGGSAGATAIYYASGLSPLTTCSIVVGSGGLNLYGEADAGGTSTITIGSTTIIARGGGGGGHGSSGSGSGPGLPTSGGIASNGTINLAGGDGSPGDGSGLRLITGGTGGTSFWGGGGRQSCNASVYGAGGGGVGYLGGCLEYGGAGSGAAGICVIEWFQ